MFGAFFDDEDYTLPAIIAALKEERFETMMVKASMSHSIYAHKLNSIIEALERVERREKGAAR